MPAKPRHPLWTSILILALILTWAAAESSLAARSKPAIQKGKLNASAPIQLGEQVTIRQDSCSLPYPGENGWVAQGWIQGNETYYTLKDPFDTDCVPTAPFGITEIKFAIHYPGYCSTSIYFEIYDASDDPCPVPGDLLYTSPPTPFQVGGGPWTSSFVVDLHDTVCVWEPFFLSFTFPDSVDCFEMFIDEDPGPCRSYTYDYALEMLIDHDDYDFPGQIWMYASGLDAELSGCNLLQPDTFFTIPEVYQNIAFLDDEEISVFGEFTSPDDSKLVTVYGEYLLKELMPAASIIFLTGDLPTQDYWYGGTMIVTGTISTEVNPEPMFPAESLFVTIDATSFEYVTIGFDTTEFLSPFEGSEPNDAERSEWLEEECDPCKFAVLIGGSTDPNRNNPGFWSDIESLYVHKTTDTSAGGEGYCPENVEVVYNNGVSGNPAVIPHDAVDSLSMENIQAAMDSVAAGVAECHRQGKPATVQKMITGHGKNDSGLVIGPNDYLNPEEMREMQQEIIDSCCSKLYDEFLQCYGGDMLDSLAEIDDQGKTEIHGNSEAGSNSPGVQNRTWGSPYLQKKIKRLQAGDDYETAVDSAKSWYQRYLVRVIKWYDDKIDSLQDIVDILPPGKRHDRADTLKGKYEGLKDRVENAKDEGSPSWVRYQMTHYCQWKKVTAQPGGQLKFKFTGSGGCGNVKLYRQNADGSKTRIRTWNWNLPRSPGYQEGNENRYYTVPAEGPGTYWVHNDNGKFTMTCFSLVQPQAGTSASNRQDFAGGSCGGSDGSSSEFTHYVAPTWQTFDTFGDEFDLENVPSVIGSAGVWNYLAHFDVPEYNEWWSNLGVWINILEVTEPGILSIGCIQAESSLVEVPILDPGEYLIPIGGIDPLAPMVELHFLTNLKASCNFEWDSWGVQSLVPIEFVWFCGDADGSGFVNITDAVYLIQYIFNGGPEPDPYEAGDANCDGTVNITDAVYLITYIFGGCPEPCDTNGDGIPDC